jgi:DNA-directed RNA polymerase specialized sigma24 family protein
MTARLQPMSTAEGFDRLVEQFRSELLAYCYRMLGSSHDAEDLVQETYLRAWRAREQYDATRSSGAVIDRSSLRLAFAAALQHLSARQRGALILRDVLRFSASEVADILGTTVVSVNSSLQRARTRVKEVGPSRSVSASRPRPSSAPGWTAT